MISMGHLVSRALILVIFLANVVSVQCDEFVDYDLTSLSSRRVQDQTACQALSSSIVAGTTTADIKDSCQCSDVSDGTRLLCRKDNLCLVSDGGDPMQGDFQTIYTMSGSGASYSRQIVMETCFTYPSTVNEGEKVCLSVTSDGIGTVLTCEIKVGGDACNVCRYCAAGKLSFDCSNLGYEERTACGDDNANDSIVQFLYNPELSTACPGGGGGGGSGASSLTPSPVVTTSASSLHLGLTFGLIATLLMC